MPRSASASRRLPEIPAANIDGLKLERLTVESDDSAVDEQLQRLAGANKNWTDAKKGHAAATGDLVVMDFAGSVDGTPFEGGTGSDMQVELGSGQLIPGFEEQLVGAKVGDEREINVTFPDDYPAEKLKGSRGSLRRNGQGREDRRRSPSSTTISRRPLGLQDLEQLKGILRDQQQQELNGLTRTHMKRRLLDELASRHSLPGAGIDGRRRIPEHHAAASPRGEP